METKHKEMADNTSKNTVETLTRQRHDRAKTETQDADTAYLDVIRGCSCSRTKL